MCERIPGRALDYTLSRPGRRPHLVRQRPRAGSRRITRTWGLTYSIEAVLADIYEYNAVRWGAEAPTGSRVLLRAR